MLSLDCIARFEASADLGQTKLFQSEIGLFPMLYLLERRARTRGAHAGPLGLPSLDASLVDKLHCSKRVPARRIRQSSRARQHVHEFHTWSRTSPKL
jgi:hypothetical protein